MATLIGTKGNDHILGTPREFNVIFGDPYTEGKSSGIDDNDQVLDAGRGGNDRLDGRGGAANIIIGDAGLMSGTARGGNDRIFGGDDFDFLKRGLTPIATCPAARGAATIISKAEAASIP